MLMLVHNQLLGLTLAPETPLSYRAQRLHMLPPGPGPDPVPDASPVEAIKPGRWHLQEHHKLSVTRCSISTAEPS